MAPAMAEAGAEEQGGSTSSAPKRLKPAIGNLSETWGVEAKHEGCYTGGKVAWCEAAGQLGCLCNEELHLVPLAGTDPVRRVQQEADAVLTFALAPSGKSACTSHRSGLLRHYDFGEAGASLVRSWKAHDQIISDLAFDATGAFVATGSVDKTAKVWDFSGYFCTHNFKGHAALVSLVRFHPSRLQLATVADTEIRLWDLASSSLVGVMKDHLTSISSLCFGKVKGGAHQLVSGGRDQVVNVWQLEDKCALARSIPVFESVDGVAVVPVGELRHACGELRENKAPLIQWLRKQDKPPPYLIMVVGSKCQLRAFNPVDGKCVATLESPHAAKGVMRQVQCVDASGRKIVTIGDDMNIVLWSLPECKVINYIMGHNEEIVHVQMIPRLSWQAADDKGEGSQANVAADRFIALANDEHPRVVSCAGFRASLLRGHADLVLSCDVSVDGKWIATGGKDQSIRVWCAESCRCVCTVAGHSAPVSALSFPKKRPKGPKGAAVADKQPLLLLSGSHDKAMKLWELPSPAKMAEASESGVVEEMAKAKVTVIAHTKEVNDITVAPNNKCLASAGHDKLIRIWSFPELKLLGECKGHRKAVWCVAFSPTDQVIASASGDSTVRLWNLQDYSPIRAFQGHDGAVLRVSFLANGMQFMSSGADGLLKLWQIRTADCAATFDEHEGRVWCIDIVGDRMLSGGSDSKLCLWRDTTKEQTKERHDAMAELAMKDTRIGVLVKEGKIEAALSLALDLDRPGQMRHIMTTYAMDAATRALDAEAKGADAKDKNGGATPDVNVRRWVRSLSREQLEKFVGIVDQWNTNRKMAPLAQLFISVLVAEVPAETLQRLEGMNATCESLLSYFERHQARVDSLLQKTFVFDLVLQSSGMGLALMDEFDGAHVQREASSGPYNEKGDHRKSEAALKTTMDVLLGGTSGDVAAVAAGADESSSDADCDAEEEEEEEEGKGEKPEQQQAKGPASKRLRRK